MNLNDKILEYLKHDFWKKSLMISGQWGSGKTTSINNFIVNYSCLKTSNLKYTHYCFINGYEIDKDFDLKKHIIKNSRNIRTRQLDPLINRFIKKNLPTFMKMMNIVETPIRKIEKPIKKIGNYIFKTTTQIPLDIPSDIIDAVKDNVEFIYDSNILTNCILIIDEVDRKQDIKLKLIFSKIIDILEKQNMKVIFVVNKENLIEEDSDFNEWFEKIFDFEVNIEESSNKIKVPNEFSFLFKKYFNENIKSFINYRSLEKYEKMIKIIDEKFKHAYHDSSKKSIVSDFKEALFYNIFRIDNPNLFSNEINKKEDKNKARLIYLTYTNEVIDFLNLNYTPAFNKINFEFNHHNGVLGKINKLTDKYLRSHYICHRIDRKGISLPDPLNFVVSEIINEHKDSLTVDCQSYKEGYRLNYWVKTAIKLGADDNQRSDILNILLEKINKYIKELIKNDKIYLFKYGEIILSTMSTTYKKEFVGQQKFLADFNNLIEKGMSDVANIILSDIRITDSDSILNYSMNNNNKTLEIIINKSDDFIDDLRKLYNLNSEKYIEMEKDYINKYPNDNNRPIKDWMLKIIYNKDKDDPILTIE